MVIYSETNQVILDIPVDDTSYRYRAIRQGDKVYLYFSLTRHVEIPTYSYIDFQGQRYTLWKPENLTKHGERNLEYTVEFGGWWEMLNRTKYKLLSAKPHKLKFPLTAGPRMFLQLLVDNLNLHDSGWTLGTCIEAAEKALAFSHETCMEVINRFADEWNTEFEFVGKTINFGKVEKFKDAPLPLSYGKGNGFKTGVARQNQGEKAPVTILYVQGGDRNIDSSQYGSTSLLLPKDQELEYQGRHYKTDADGMFITRADHELTTYNEDGYDATNIYPSRVGTISEVVTVDVAKNFYDIKDNTVPDALDYTQCRIAGEKATIIFQSGIMAGKEFDLEQTDKGLTGYIHAERRFKIVPQEIDGTIMPNETFKPSIGDTYAIFNISLPDAYVCDNATQTGASWDMFRDAVRYMYENEEENFSFTGELDGIWAKKKWLEIGGKLQPGSYILFSDTQFQPEGLPIRITGIKDYINNPHSPELELSNTPVAGFLSSDLGKLEGNEVKDEERHNNALSFTKRRWHDTIEALSMLEAAISGFSAAINPITIQTMAMLVGDESLQFRFVNSKTNPSEIIPDFKYNQQAKVFTVPAGILQHMTLGVSKLSSSHAASEYKYWNMSAYVSPPLDETDAMYLYAKCSKSGTTGTFILSKTPYKMDPGDGYYYFLTGALSSEFETERSFVTVYGFTEILPGRITVGMIVSPNGQTYFNVAQGEIGGKIVFKAGTTGYNNISDRPNLNDWAYSIITDANQQTVLDVTAAKEALAKNLGYSSYAAMVMSAADGETIIDGGYVRSNLIDAEAIVTKALVTRFIDAAYIQALNIVTGNLTVTDGAKVADFNISEGRLSYIGELDPSNGKIAIKNMNTVSFQKGGARAILLGCNLGATIPGSSSQNTNVNAMIFDNVSTSSYGGKKTALAVGCDGGSKNTALVARGNIAVTGNVVGCGIPISGSMPSSSTGFDHNCCIVDSGTFNLPTGETLLDWFGTNPNTWRAYCGNKGGMDAQDYDLYVICAFWATGTVRISGNSGGNNDYSGITGTPLYGQGVVRSGYGYVDLKAGQSAHFKKVGRAWYCLGIS